MPEDFEDPDRPRRRRDREDDEDVGPRRRRIRDEADDVAPHRGGLILALGILGLFVCQVVGIASWIMGAADLREMREGRMDPEGKGLTQVGMILGIISVALTAISLIVFGIIIVLAIAAAGGN